MTRDVEDDAACAVGSSSSDEALLLRSIVPGVPGVRGVSGCVASGRHVAAEEDEVFLGFVDDIRPSLGIQCLCPRMGRRRPAERPSIRWLTRVAKDMALRFPVNGQVSTCSHSHTLASP